jgi:hypothetical protein
MRRPPKWYADKIREYAGEFGPEFTRKQVTDHYDWKPWNFHHGRQYLKRHLKPDEVYSCDPRTHIYRLESDLDEGTTYLAHWINHVTNLLVGLRQGTSGPLKPFLDGSATLHYLTQDMERLEQDLANVMKTLGKREPQQDQPRMMERV